jgi:tetratricopeptide (TPR) repeat protein
VIIRWLVLIVLLSASTAAPGQSPDPSLPLNSARSADVENLQERIETNQKKIEITRGQIEKVRDANFLPDLYFALADLQSERARLLVLQKTEALDGTGKRIEDLDLTAERRPKQEAIDIYQKIYSFFPQSERRDRALYLKGLEHRELGQFDEMIRSFQLLAKEFPKSTHFNESSLILGDFMLEQRKDPQGALEAFKRIIERGESPFQAVAHYRAGWCHINLNQNEEAVTSFERALSAQKDLSLVDLPELYRRIDIRREAVLALPVPYVEVLTDPKRSPGLLPKENVVPYFTTLAPDHFTLRRALVRAARRLSLKERWTDSAEAEFAAVRLTFDLEAMIDGLRRIQQVNQKKLLKVDRLQLIEEGARATELLLRQSPRLERRGRKDRQSLQFQSWDRFLELLIRDYATGLQVEAKRSNDRAEFARAARAYEIYFQWFAHPGLGVIQNSRSLRINLAESLYRAEEWYSAGALYEELASERRERDQRRWGLQQSAIESYSRALAGTLSPIHQLRARRGLREVASDWLRDNPKHPGAATAQLNIANSFYEERNLKEAIPALRRFIATYPNDPRVRDVGILLINSHSQLDDFAGLERAGAEVLKTSALREEDRAAIREAMERARTKQVQAAAGQFGTREYAQSLVDLASQQKGSALGSQALYEAFLSLRSKMDPDLFTVGQSFINSVDSADSAMSSRAKEVASSMAQLSLSVAAFDRAAQILSAFSDRYSSVPEAVSFRATAAQLFEVQGEFRQARDLYGKMARNEDVARMDVLAQDWARLAESARALSGPTGEHLRALALWRLNRRDEAIPLMRAFVSKGQGSADEIGHFRFLLGLLERDEYQKIQMKSGEDQAALGQKIQRFQALQASLERLIQGGGTGRWVIAGLYLMGRTQVDLAQFISKSPAPSGLSAADLKAYRTELQSQAKETLKQAEAIFRKCTETAERAEIFTLYVAGCRSKGRLEIDDAVDLASSRRRAVQQRSTPQKAKALRRQLFERPRDTEVLEDLAVAYLQDGQASFALSILSRAEEISPDRASTMALRGVAELSLGEFAQARESFRRSLAKNGREPTALYHLLELFRHFEFRQKAEALQKQARGAGPPRLRVKPGA